MSARQTVIFPGSFDPFTLGHNGLVNTALSLFDCVIIAVATNAEKRCLFTPEERLGFISQHYFGHPDHPGWPWPESRVEVVSIGSRSVARYARERDAVAIIRSFRNFSDFEKEFALQAENAEIAPEVVTVYLPPPEGHPRTSSTLVKALMATEDVYQRASEYVPEHIYQALLKKYQKGEFAADPSKESR